MTTQGVQGAIFQMVSHGLVSGALFLCVGVVYDRMHTREIAAYGGLVKRMPLYAVTFMIFTMANVGLPGTSGFVGEFLTLVGAFVANTWVAFFATTGVILSAAYALYLYRRVDLRRARQAVAADDQRSLGARDRRSSCRSSRSPSITACSRARSSTPRAASVANLLQTPHGPGRRAQSRGPGRSLIGRRRCRSQPPSRIISCRKPSSRSACWR